jgi:hypothetical protein
VTSLKWSGQGFLISGSQDRTIRVYNASEVTHFPWPFFVATCRPAHVCARACTDNDKILARAW